MAGSLLSDQEIVAALRDGALRVSDLPENDGGKLSSGKDSPIQPSSLDLHVGKILIPPPTISQFNITCKEDKDAISRFSIPPGNTIIVETLEEISLSREISAFGFPPASLAGQSILMTNPGHIDPGYSGRLKFTIINMGRSGYIINRGDRIVSLLIFRLKNGVAHDYSERRGGTIPAPNYPNMLRVLAHDFANFTARMEDAASAAVKSQIANLDRSKLWLPVMAGAIATILTGGTLWLTTKVPPLSQIVTRGDVSEIVDQRLMETKAAIDMMATRLESVSESHSDQQIRERIIRIEYQLEQIIRQLP